MLHQEPVIHYLDGTVLKEQGRLLLSTLADKALIFHPSDLSASCLDSLGQSILPYQPYYHYMIIQAGIHTMRSSFFVGFVMFAATK